MVRWETWTPSDPATLAELKEREEEEDQKRSKEFEESNPDFCKQMVDDMKSRSEARRVPCTINGGCRVATGCLLPTTGLLLVGFTRDGLAPVQPRCVLCSEEVNMPSPTLVLPPPIGGFVIKIKREGYRGCSAVCSRPIGVHPSFRR